MKRWISAAGWVSRLKSFRGRTVSAFDNHWLTRIGPVVLHWANG
ncbi:hypothetical protein WKK05_37280 (plasmid) [Nostoc sp. UHCC 0302]